MLSFWQKRKEWLPTWNNLRQREDVSNALQVDYIRVYEYDPTKRVTDDTTDWFWYLWGMGRKSLFD